MFRVKITADDKAKFDVEMKSWQEEIAFPASDLFKGYDTVCEQDPLWKAYRTVTNYNSLCQMSALKGKVYPKSKEVEDAMILLKEQAPHYLSVT